MQLNSIEGLFANIKTTEQVKTIQAIESIGFNQSVINRSQVKLPIIKDDMPDQLDKWMIYCKRLNENVMILPKQQDSLALNRDDKFLSKYDTRFTRFAKEFIKRFNESNFTNLSYTIIHERGLIAITNLKYRQINEA